MNNSMVHERDRSHVISISAIFFCLIIIYSFTTHIVLNTFSGYVYIGGIVLLTVAYILTGKYFYKESSNIYYFLIAIAAFTVLIGYLRSRRNDALIDFVVIFCGYLFVRFHGDDGGKNIKAIRVITFFALVFSIGVLLQALLPGIHRAIIRVFPTNFASAIVNGVEDTTRGNRGFTTNAGHAAGYICAGIISLFAQTTSVKQAKGKTLVLLIIMFVGLAFTGKRGPILFVILTIFLYYLLPYKGSKKVKRYWRVFLVLATLIVMYTTFRDVLVRVPIINEIARTIEGMTAGDDVSSLRLSLYAWALKLFTGHPLFGIGWGAYRTTVVGNVTYMKVLDTHNIYLQLLAETGIVGFAIFAILFAVMWNKTKKAYIASLSSDIAPEWRISISFSFIYQTFFLLYGLTANTLYDQHYQILYMVSCAIYAGYQFHYSRNKGLVV